MLTKLLNVPIYEYRISVHLSFTFVLLYKFYWFFWLNFLLSILSDIIFNILLFLISFQDYSFPKYRNVVNCLIYLHLITLVHMLCNSSSFFFKNSLGFSTYKNMLFMNRDSFISSFPVWMPFIYFSCLIALTSTSDTMLCGSSKSRHHSSSRRRKHLAVHDLVWF